MTSFLSVYSTCAVIFIILINLFLYRRRKKAARSATEGAAPFKENTGKAAYSAASPAADQPDKGAETLKQALPLAEEKGTSDQKKVPITPKSRREQSKASDKKFSPITVIVVLVLGAFIALLNQTLMNVALPKIMTDLNISTSTAQWTTTGYMLVNGVLIPITAFLMETFTTRKLFLTAMGLFTLGSAVCALSPNFSILMTGRVIQASGAGIIMPLMTNVFLNIFPPEKRGGAMGIMGLAMIFAPAVGPTLSGYIVEHFNWRLLFWIVFPLGLLDILLAWRFLQNVGRRTFPKLDVSGVVLSTVGFGGILYAFSEAGNNGWSDTAVITTLIVGSVSLALFVWRELTAETPVLEMRVFKYSIFTFTTIINILITMALFAAMILLPIYLQNIRGFTPLESGLLLLPGAILMGVMSPITGMLFDRIGSRPLAVAGLIITVITTWGFAQLTDTTSYTHILLLYSVRMFGMSLLMMPIMTEGLNNLPRELNSHGTAMSNTMRQVAGSLGTAFLVTVMTNRTTDHVAEYSDHITSGNTILAGQLGSAGQALGNSGHLPAAAGQTAMLQMIYGKVEQMATIQGINDAFLVATLLTVLALILSFFIKRATPPKKKPEEKAESKPAPVQASES
ncbi:DHA2 family efflux MFS transporter permease subunit [Sporolactobacillus sp. THM7-7]|nr:DHA2 family efflux MFS transporter permease subunit [Sporolactobacillus sp. THM7-7]